MHSALFFCSTVVEQSDPGSENLKAEFLTSKPFSISLMYCSFSRTIRSDLQAGTGCERRQANLTTVRRTESASGAESAISGGVIVLWDHDPDSLVSDVFALLEQFAEVVLRRRSPLLHPAVELAFAAPVRGRVFLVARVFFDHFACCTPARFQRDLWERSRQIEAEKWKRINSISACIVVFLPS